MLQPTPQQHEAITNTEQNLIVVAGAGSGKTRVLVERYLYLLKVNPDWSLNALVAITFTREAALEMRNRVRSSLEQSLKSATEPADIQRWATLLTQMDSARIDTIHGLCTTILRANASVIGIDPGFDVMEAVDSGILLETVVNDVLQNATKSDLKLFNEYDAFQIRQVLTDSALMDVQLADLSDDWMREWQTQWETFRDARLADFKKHPALQAMLDWQPPAGIPADDRTYQMWTTTQTAVTAYLATDNGEELNQHLEQFCAINLVGGSDKQWGGKEIRQEAKAILTAIRDTARAIRKIIGDPPDHLDEQATQLLPIWHSLIQRVQNEYRQAKARLRVLDFGDLETRTVELLQHTEVASRYCNAEFKHLLVDEFQDTNSAQWAIIQRLADLNHGGTLFVVGDPKQSIYQFRGADVSVFNGVKSQIDSTDSNVGKSIPLAKSFRTNHRLLGCMNQFFSELLVRDESSPVSNYQVEMETMDAHRDWDCDDYSDAMLEFVLLNTANKQVHNIDMRAWEGQVLAERIQTLIDEKRPVFDREQNHYRPIEYRDFAMLFRSMNDVVLYETALKDANIPYVTVAGKGYYSRQEIWDMLNLLKSLYNLSDDLSLATVLRSPMFSFSDDMLFALRQIVEADNPKQPIALWDSLQRALTDDIVGILSADKSKIQFAVDCLDDLSHIAGRVTISELMRQALAKTGYLAILTGLPNGIRLRSNIEKLVSVAEQSGKLSLSAFTQYLNDLSDKEIREGEATLSSDNAMRLMTVHASKGLEFPVVILADTSRANINPQSAVLRYDLDSDGKGTLSCKVYHPTDDNNSSGYESIYAYRYQQNLERQREDAERKRLLYVACTRAQDYLIMSGQVKMSSNKGWQGANGWLRDLLNLETFDFSAWQDDPHPKPVYETEQVRVHLPQYQPRPSTKSSRDLWDFDADTTDFPSQAPSMIGSVQVATEKKLGHLTATQLADLGGARHDEDEASREYFRQRFRNRAFNDAPLNLNPIRRFSTPVTGAIIGNIVHEALRYGAYVDTAPDINQVLQGFAWAEGLHEADALKDAVRRAKRLLRDFGQSELYGWIQSARDNNRPIYAELPFVLRTDKRVIHGILDLLFQRPDGTWVVVDYKTSYVLDHDVEDQAYQKHAKRYHLQVGAYAEAVRNQLGTSVAIQAYVHYIRYNETVEVPQAIWQAELMKLESYLGDLVGGS